VIEPVDHDGNPATRSLWWGRLVLTPVTTPTAWSIATGSSGRKVCRFTGDYVNNNKISNNEHPYWYRGVSGGMDNQTYLIIPGNDNCPTNGKTDLLAGNYINVNTIIHQSSGSTGGSYSDVSSQWSASAEPSSAPSSTTDVLPLSE
jgi:hypothetical protein